jgi:hypothetical protein
MTLTGLSNRGLLLIAMLVAILWGCIFAERAIVNNARRETETLLRSRGRVPVQYPKPVRQRIPLKGSAV